MDTRTLVLIVYAFTMISFFILMNFVTQGFIFKFIEVKRSRGKKAIVVIRSANGSFITTGDISENTVEYKLVNPKKGTPKTGRISITGPDCFERIIGLDWLKIDDETKAIIKPLGDIVTSHDPVKVESLYIRALTQPKVVSDSQRAKDLLFKIIVVVGVLATLWLVFKMSSKIDILLQMTDAIKQSCKAVI